MYRREYFQCGNNNENESITALAGIIVKLNWGFNTLLGDVALCFRLLDHIYYVREGVFGIYLSIYILNKENSEYKNRI